MADERSALQAEIQQRKPFRSRGQELVVGLLRTSDLVRRAVDRALSPEQDAKVVAEFDKFQIKPSFLVDLRHLEWKYLRKAA